MAKRTVVSTKNIDALKAKLAKTEADMNRVADAMDKLYRQQRKLEAYYDAIDLRIANARDKLAQKVTAVPAKKDLSVYTLWFRGRKLEARRFRNRSFNGWTIHENGKFLGGKFDYLSEARVAVATGEI